MIIEITGTGVHNQGAELMAAAISQHLRQQGEVRALLVDSDFGKARDRARHGLRLRYESPSHFGRTWLVDRLLYPGLRRELELFKAEDADAVLDAAGFAYSDQWGCQWAEKLHARVQQPWAKRQKHILLPQAFGPFTEPRLRQLMKEILPRLGLVYARDKTSLEHLRALAGDLPSLRLAPDFTNLLEGLPPEQPVAEPEKLVYIVPNARMLDKATPETAEAYPRVMSQLAEELRRAGFNAVFLIHSADDWQLCERISARAGGAGYPIVRENDPLRLKGLLGQAAFVVGSRFHALQSALSSGVPCLAWGWSHKYFHLCEDYDCAELSIPTDVAWEALAKKLWLLTDPASLRLTTERVQRHSARLKGEARAMWREVDEFLRT